MAPLRVLIVDDHAGFRALASSLLTAEGFDIVGDARDGASGIEAARRLHPDVVLLDVQLPDIDGFAVTRELARGPEPAPTILISTRSAEEYGPEVAGSGALGFIAKDELCAATVQALLVR